MAWAAGFAALSGIAVALISTASDALFLSRVGFRHFGTLFAVSSATLVVVLGYVGGLADRVDRGRLLTTAAGVAAASIAGLAVLSEVAPGPVAGVLIVVGKQFAAVIDLAFWVLVAERLDARQGRRIVPVLIAAAGVGTVVGAFAVGPLADWFGTRGVLLIAAAFYGSACIGGQRLVLRATAGTLPSSAVTLRRRGVATASWTAGWHAVRQSPLSRQLALLVAVAGVFAPILYYMLGVTAAAAYGDEASIAGFLGRFRGAVQIATLLTQILVAPVLIARVGVAPILVVAPIGAVGAAFALAAHPTLLVVALAQGATRLFDAAVQKPAEKLTQNLLARRVRGRVAGFLDGVAKRAGAILGGVLASGLVIWPRALAAATVTVAVAWLVVATLLRRRFAELAVDELVARRDDDGDDDGAWAGALVDERSVERLRGDLRAGGARTQLATELIVELSHRGRADAAAELAAAAANTTGETRRAVLGGLVRLGDAAAAAADASRVAADLRAVIDADDSDDTQRSLAARALGRLAASAAVVGTRARWRDDVQRTLVALAEGPGAPRIAARSALARTDGPDAITGLLEELLRHGDSAEQAAALDELIEETRAHASATELASDQAMSRARLLLRAVRRGWGDSGRPDGTAAACHAVAAVLSRCNDELVESAELVLLVADARSVAVRAVESGRPGAALAGRVEDSVRAAALHLLGTIGQVSDAALLARGLGDPDEGVRRAAVSALRALGAPALEVLIVAAGYGRRRARNHAVELLRELRVSNEALDELIEAELTQLDRTLCRLAPLASLPKGGPAKRRLEERADEIAHTLFLLLGARLGERVIGAAARALLHARDSSARARALETLDVVLPRPIATRLVDALDPGTAEDRSRRAAERLEIAPPSQDDAVRAELVGADPLSRALVVAALGESGRSVHREAITAAATAAARSLDPLAMLRRLSGVDAPTESCRESLLQEEDEMPRNVETMMALSTIPLFAELSTRELAELADVVRWRGATAGETIVTEGEPGESMYFLLSGSVRVEVAGSDGPRSVGTLAAGEPFGEMALFEGEPRSASVIAETKARLGRIDRTDFEELVDDVPGIALAICRVMSRRVRKMNAALMG